MTSDNEQQAWIEEEAKPNVSYLHKFRLYETRSVRFHDLILNFVKFYFEIWFVALTFN